MYKEPTPYEKARKAFETYEKLGVYDPEDKYDTTPIERWSELQARLHKWATAQLKQTGSGMSAALGVAEEFGELAGTVINTCIDTLQLGVQAGKISHIILKHNQGIRGYDDIEKTRTELADAIADMFVFAIQLCTRFKIDFGTLISATAEQVMRRKWKSNITEVRDQNTGEVIGYANMKGLAKLEFSNDQTVTDRNTVPTPDGK